MSSILSYKVLVVDDQKRPASWGEITKAVLEEFEFEVDHVNTIEEAIVAIKTVLYDIFIIDLDLQSQRTGADLHRELRAMGLSQPIILVTGNQNFLSQPLANFSDVLSQGPVQFYDKSNKRDLSEVVREVANRVDPIRRSFKLMSKAGLGGREFWIDSQKYTVDQLLQSSLTTDNLVRTLRESLYALVLESQAVGPSGNESNRFAQS